MAWFHLFMMTMISQSLLGSFCTEFLLQCSLLLEESKTLYNSHLKEALIICFCLSSVQRGELVLVVSGILIREMYHCPPYNHNSSYLYIYIHTHTQNFQCKFVFQLQKLSFHCHSLLPVNICMLDFFFFSFYICVSP